MLFSRYSDWLRAGLSGDRIPVGVRFSAPSLLYNGYWIFPGGKERPGRDANPSPLSSAVIMEEYSYTSTLPYGPDGLYSASMPVQGCTLLLLLPANSRQRVLLQLGDIHDELTASHRKIPHISGLTDKKCKRKVCRAMCRTV